MREMVGLINGSGLRMDMNDLRQITNGTRSQFLNFALDIGTTPNHLVTMFRPNITELMPGMPLHVYIANDNTGPATILVDHIGPVYIIRGNGASLAPGDLYAGQIAALVYDGSYFQLQNYLGKAADTLTNNFYRAKIPYAQDTSSTANTINAPYNPVLTHVFPGLLVEVRVANTNTGPINLYANSLPGTPIRRPSLTGFQDFASGEIVAGQVLLLCYDSMGQWQMVNAPKTKLPYDKKIDLVNRYTYQSTNQAMVIRQDDNTNIFVADYVPKAAGNRLKVSVTGGMGYESLTCPRICIYLAYRVNAASSSQYIYTAPFFGWMPSQFPGLDYPPSFATHWQGNPGGGQIVDQTVETDFSRQAFNALMANVAVVGFEYPESNSTLLPGAPPSGIQEPASAPTYGWPIGTAFKSTIERSGVDWASLAWEFTNTRMWERFGRNFVINAHLSVPPGPPASMSFGLFFRPISAVEWANDLAPIFDPAVHLCHGGVMLQVFEYTA